MIPLETPVTGDRFNSGLLQTIHMIRDQHGMDPLHFVFWAVTSLRQRHKARERARAGKAGLEIPPLLILNLAYLYNFQRNSCSKASGEPRFLDVSTAERAGSLFRQASRVGVGMVLITGGEPLLRPEILLAAGDQKDILFALFTGGTWIDQPWINYFRNHRNLIPILNPGGHPGGTDHLTISKMEQLQLAGIPHGVCFTLTRDNFAEVTHPIWLRSFRELGCSLFFFNEQMTLPAGGTDRGISEAQKENMTSRMDRSRGFGRAFVFLLPVTPGGMKTTRSTPRALPVHHNPMYR